MASGQRDEVQVLRTGWIYATGITLMSVLISLFYHINVCFLYLYSCYNISLSLGSLLTLFSNLIFFLLSWHRLLSYLCMSSFYLFVCLFMFLHVNFPPSVCFWARSIYTGAASGAAQDSSVLGAFGCRSWEVHTV